MNKCQSKNPSACRFHGSGGVTRQQLEEANNKASQALNILAEQTHYHRLSPEGKQRLENDYNAAMKEAHKLRIKYDTTAEGFNALEQELKNQGFPQVNSNSEIDQLAARYFYAKQLREEELTYSSEPLYGTKYSERELCVEYDIPKKYLDKILNKAPAGLVNRKEPPSKELRAARINTMVAKYNYHKLQQESLFSQNDKKLNKAFNILNQCMAEEDRLHHIHLKPHERALLEKIEKNKKLN